MVIKNLLMFFTIGDDKIEPCGNPYLSKFEILF